MLYSPSFPGLTPFILSLCAVLTSCCAPPWEMDRRCELGVYMCLYTAQRVDLVVMNMVIVHRQQLDKVREGWMQRTVMAAMKAQVALLPWHPMTPSSSISLQERPVLSPLQQSLCLRLRSPCHRGTIFKGPLSSWSTLPAPCTGCHNVTQCSGRKGVWRQMHEKHRLSNPGAETTIHSWIVSWRRFTADLGRRGNLRSYKYLVLLAEHKMCSFARGLLSSHLRRQLLWMFGIKSGFCFNGLWKTFF